MVIRASSGGSLREMTEGKARLSGESEAERQRRGAWLDQLIEKAGDWM